MIDNSYIVTLDIIEGSTTFVLFTIMLKSNREAMNEQFENLLDFFVIKSLLACIIFVLFVFCIL